MTPPRPDTADLLALAVHEFRTPVTVVAGYLSMLSRGQIGPLTERQRGLVEEAERSCARLSALVSEMSDLSNLEAGSALVAHDDVDLAAVVDEVSAQVTEGRDRHVRVVRDSEVPSLVVAGDRKRLREVVSSLLVAVLREQGGPGEVMVRTSLLSLDGRQMAALAIGPGDTARFVLSAHGPDARLNESRGGLGLALPVARRVIERLEGRIWSSAAERTLGAIAIVVPVKENHS